MKETALTTLDGTRFGMADDYSDLLMVVLMALACPLCLPLVIKEEKR